MLVDYRILLAVILSLTLILAIWILLIILLLVGILRLLVLLHMLLIMHIEALLAVLLLIILLLLLLLLLVILIVTLVICWRSLVARNTCYILRSWILIIIWRLALTTKSPRRLTIDILTITRIWLVLGCVILWRFLTSFTVQSCSDKSEMNF